MVYCAGELNLNPSKLNPDFRFTTQISNFLHHQLKLYSQDHPSSLVAPLYIESVGGSGIVDLPLGIDSFHGYPRQQHGCMV